MLFEILRQKPQNDSWLKPHNDVILSGGEVFNLVLNIYIFNLTLKSKKIFSPYLNI